MRRVDEIPFIVSNLSEREVMLKKAAAGLALMAAAISVLFFALIVIAGSGGFASTDYLLAALATPFFFAVLMVIMMYNDLVFLRQRARRAWANIQVSLKKRAELLPQLESIVKAMAGHERAVLEQIAELRRLAHANASQADVERLLREEQQAMNSLVVTAEAYPDMKSDTNFRDLATRMSALETEVAMMRAGYNDAVEYYNTRINTFPDLLLARLGKLTALQLLAA
jgi:hypothetical protein